MRHCIALLLCFALFVGCDSDPGSPVDQIPSDTVELDGPPEVELLPDTEPDRIDVEPEQESELDLLPDEAPDDELEAELEHDSAELEPELDDEVEDLDEQSDVVEPQRHDEVEPNNGSSDTDFNLMQIDWAMHGAVAPAKDVDIFRLQTTPGWVYRIRLEALDQLQGHLTVFDDGRNGKPYADDYVKLALSEGQETRLELLAMGQGGYYIGVQDRRNTQGGSVGGVGFEYVLTVEALSVESFGSVSLAVPSDQNGSLSGAGEIALYAFDGVEGSDIWFELRAQNQTPPQGMDGRLIVFSRNSGDWLARNDNRSVGDLDPLVDAPLFGSGPMLLLVENINEAASTLAYRLQAQ